MTKFLTSVMTGCFKVKHGLPCDVILYLYFVLQHMTRGRPERKVHKIANKNLKFPGSGNNVGHDNIII